MLQRPIAPIIGPAQLPSSTEDGMYSPITLSVDLTSLLIAGVESLGHGLAAFDEQRRLCFANSVARSLLRVLRWSTGDIGTVCTLPARWSEALFQVCVKGRRELARLPAREPSGSPVQRARTSSIPGYAALVPVDSAGQRLALAIFGRAELCGAVELELYALRHGMTAAESEVLRQLCVGLPAAEIARARQVSVTTVLTQIDAIRHKTETRSVRQLMHDLSRMPQLRTAA